MNYSIYSTLGINTNLELMCGFNQINFMSWTTLLFQQKEKKKKNEKKKEVMH